MMMDSRYVVVWMSTPWLLLQQTICKDQTLIVRGQEDRAKESPQTQGNLMQESEAETDTQMSNAREA